MQTYFYYLLSNQNHKRCLVKIFVNLPVSRSILQYEQCTQRVDDYIKLLDWDILMNSVSNYGLQMEF